VLDLGQCDTRLSSLAHCSNAEAPRNSMQHVGFHVGILSPRQAHRRMRCRMSILDPNNTVLRIHGHATVANSNTISLGGVVKKNACSHSILVI